MTRTPKQIAAMLPAPSDHLLFMGNDEVEQMQNRDAADFQRLSDIADRTHEIDPIFGVVDGNPYDVILADGTWVLWSGQNQEWQVVAA